jgi:hypothetical protein
MKTPSFFCATLTLLAGAFLLTEISFAQAGDDVPVSRGAFITSRKHQQAPTSVPRIRRHKPARTQSGTEAKKPASSLALGYTIFQRDETDQARRASASQTFRAGDAVRLMIEASVDGYLYVFHTENGQHPQMLFPDARLNRGNNRITAHVPYEIPSRREADARFRWFYFDDQAATERLYVVVTKNPLPAVPAGEQLLALCASGQQTDCLWKPAAAVWQQIVSRSAAMVSVDESGDEGNQETATETEAVTRGLNLRDDAPAPTRIFFSKQANADRLLIQIDLVHR